MADRQSEIESLYVTIRGDVDELLKSAREGVKATEGELGKIDQKSKQVTASFQQQGKQSAAALGLVIAAATSLFGILGQLVAAVPRFFAGIVGGAIQTGKQFERFTVQYTTILKSTAAAQQRIAELQKIGLKTPYELDQLVEADRLLTTFGARSVDNLLMVGDAAAGTSNQIERVAFWSGRLYDAIQSGRPIGEATMALQEMGIISGATRNQLENLQKAGRSGPEIWAKYSQLVGSRFAGAMDKLSATLEGTESNLSDFQNNLLRVGGQAVFEELRDEAQRLLADLQANQKPLEELAAGVGDLAAAALKLVSAGFFDAIEGVKPETLQALAASLQNAAAAMDKMDAAGTVTLLDDLAKFATVWTDLNVAVSNFNQSGSMTGGIVNGIKDALSSLISPLGTVREAFNSIDKAVQQISGKTVTDVTGQLAGRAPGPGLELPPAETPPAEPPPETPAETAADNKTRDRAIALNAELLDLQEETLQEREELIAEHNQEVIDIETDYVDKRLELGEKLADELAGLESETAARRGEILREASQELADLAKETDQGIADQQADFNEQERRETEDHLTELRRLRQNYLFNLADLVTARDARGIVDLRRRYQEERGAADDNFRTQQQREREDQDARLAEIRQNETERADEITRAREADLLSLAETERQKRAELQASFQEQMVKLDENRLERLGKEQADYTTRQAELDQAMTNRLETIAKELAAEVDLEQSAAEAILTQLAETYGPEGSALAILEEYVNRRNELLASGAEFEGETSTSPGHVAADYGTGNQRSFATGGSMIANHPTLVQFAEAGPELATFTPLSQIHNMDNRRSVVINISATGQGGQDIANEISRVMVSALRQAGLDS